MRSSGRQTDRLLSLYHQQVVELQKQSTNTHELAVQAKNQADRTKDVADRALTQANATNKLATEAKRAADIAKDSLKAQTRPWIGISVDSVSVPRPPAHTPNPNAPNLDLTFRIVLQNYGHSPAQGVIVRTDTILHSRPTEWKQKMNACMNQASGKVDVSDVVFPGEQGIFHKNSRVVVRANAGNFVILCVSYDDDYTTHHTGAIFACTDKEGSFSGHIEDMKIWNTMAD